MGYQQVRQSCSNAAVACSESRRPAARTTLQCVVVKFELGWGLGMLVRREVSPSPDHGSTREQGELGESEEGEISLSFF
jgi:hypothetical protein